MVETIIHSIFSILECTGKARQLEFARIFRGTSHGDKFDSVKPFLDTFINGGISCILNHGTTRSGKTITMFGNEETVGLLKECGEYIFKSLTEVSISAFEIIENVCSDLIKTQPVQSIDKFKSHVEYLRATRKQAPTNQNQFSSRSHLFIHLSSNESKIAFVDLAGFERPKAKDNAAETTYINSSLSELNSILFNMTQHKAKKAQFNQANQLPCRLAPFLQAPSKTIILFHVSKVDAKKGLEYIKDITTSTKVLKRRNADPLGDITNKTKTLRP